MAQRAIKGGGKDGIVNNPADFSPSPKLLCQDTFTKELHPEQGFLEPDVEAFQQKSSVKHE